MNETRVAYLAGVIDTGATFKLKIKPDERYAIGYHAYPLVMLTRFDVEDAVLDRLEAYCEAQGVTYRRIERSDRDSQRFTVTGVENMKSFLGPLLEYLDQQHRQVETMLDDIVPLLESNDGLTRADLYALAGYAETLRETNRGRTPAKYTQEFFAEEWADDPEFDPAVAATTD